MTSRRFTESNVRLPRGVRDFLPAAATKRRAIADSILTRFDRWGYQRLITPQFEVADVLERGLGAGARRGAVRFIEPDTGDVVFLRPDITPQVARVAATRFAEVGAPLRLCYDGIVTRQTAGARIQRELLQAGVELFGVAGSEGDAEIVALAAEVLAAEAAEAGEAANLSLGGASPLLELGHVAPSRLLFSSVDDEELSLELRDALVRRDQPSARRLGSRLDSESAQLAAALPRLCGPLDEVERMLEMPDHSSAALAVCREAIEHVKSVLVIAKRLAPSAVAGLPIVVDLGEVRGFPYYTGLRLSGWLPGVGDAALVGGRYDNLVARFGRQREATGFAVDIEHVAAARLARPRGGEPTVGLLIESAAVDASRADTLAASLRTAGFRCTRTSPLGGNHADIARERGFAGVLSFRSAASSTAAADLPVDSASDAIFVRINGQEFSVDAARISQAIDGNLEAIEALAKGKNK